MKEEKEIEFDYERILAEDAKNDEDGKHLEFSYPKSNFINGITRASGIAPNNHVVQKMLSEYLGIRK